MNKKDFLKKFASRKFWACITAVIVSLIAFTKATPETAERVVALIGAIGGLCVYMLSEGMADSKDETNIINTDSHKNENSLGE